jgi:hypothetical protein
MIFYAALEPILIKYSLIVAFAFVGLLVWFSYWVSTTITKGYIHGSAIAIGLGLLFAYIGGFQTGGDKGIADCLLG